MLKKRTLRNLSRRSLPRRNENTTKRLPTFSQLYQNHSFLDNRSYLIYWQNFLINLTKLVFLFKFSPRKLRSKGKNLTLSLIILFLVTNSASLENEVLANLPREPSGDNSPTFAEIKAKVAPLFYWPLPGEVSQKFSYYHKGIDIPNPYGTEIKSIAAGIVEKTGFETGFGKTIIVSHEGGFKSRYAHLSKIDAKQGDRIPAKTLLGKVGTSGWADGAHLHLEIYSNESAIDPLNILPASSSDN